MKHWLVRSDSINCELDMGGDVCTNANDEAQENVTNRMDTPTSPNYPAPPSMHCSVPVPSQLITSNLMNYKI